MIVVDIRDLEPVELAECDLQETKARQIMERKLGTQPEALGADTPRCFMHEFLCIPNAFLEAWHYAFALHRPLVISPDHLWLTVVQGALITICGVPQVVLEGTVDDWRSIRERARQFAEFGLGHWCEHLDPVLQQFAFAAEGRADPRWWDNFYKWLPPDGSGSEE